MAVANSFPDTVSVLLNNGNGTFALPVKYVAGFDPRSVAIGDLDGDGDLDLATANSFFSVSDTVSVLLNHGDGTFATHVQYGTGVNPTFVGMGDLDRDGDLDLAVTNSLSRSVSVLINHGNATFAAHVQYGTGTTPSSVAIGDLDRDGDLDLAVANRFFNPSVSVLLNDSDGTFAPETRYGAKIPWSVQAGTWTATGTSTSP